MTNKIRFIRFAFFLLTLISTTSVFADVKIKTRSTAGGGQSESTTYIKGKRQRSEDAAGESVSIMQCDLRRTVELAPAAKTYRATSFDELFGTQTAGATKTSGKTETTVVRGGTVTTTYTVKDTGERKQMFGYAARRVITTIESVSSPDACSKNDTKMEMDEWVIDAEFALACDEMKRAGSYTPPASDGCQDKHILKNVGTAKHGYPLYTKMTIFGGDGKPSQTSVNEVIELSKSTLNAALFDVPADYREVKDSSELYASNGSTSQTTGGAAQMPSMPGANASSAGNSSAGNSGVNVGNASNDSGDGDASLGAKKAGVVRIGLAGVKTGAVGEGVNASELSAAVQNTLAEYLKTPNVEVVRLEAKLPSAIDAEAKEKECDFVIYANVSHKKGGGMFGKALGGLSETLSRRAYGSSDTIGKATQITVMTAAAATGNVKAKDQLTLEIKLVAAGNASPVAAKQFQAKAKADGEDIITPLVEQAAQMIVDAAAKK